MTVTEKVAYLKGLMEGLSVDETSKEGKILKAVVDVLDDLAMSVEDLEDYTAELTEQVDAVDRGIWIPGKTISTANAIAAMTMRTRNIYDITCPMPAATNSAWMRIPCWRAVSSAPNCGEHLEFDVECDDCGCDCCSDEEDEEK